MAVDENSGDKSRRERRKEARFSRRKKKFDSWVQHQQSRKSKKSLASKSDPLRTLALDNVDKDCTMQPQKEEISVREVRGLKAKSACTEGCSEQFSSTVNSKFGKKKLKGKKGLSKCSKSNFSEYLELEVGDIHLSSERDLRLEGKLAKKLKVQNGRLGAANDGIDAILQGIPSAMDRCTENEEIQESVELSGESAESNSESEELVDKILVDEYSEDSDSMISGYEENVGTAEEEIVPHNIKERTKRKTNFEDYLIHEMYSDRNLAEDELALERKLSKKLKVKEGNLWGDDDGVNMLLEGIPSVLDSLGDEHMQAPENHTNKNLDIRLSSKKLKTSKLNEKEQNSKREIDPYIAACEPVKGSPEPNKFLHKVQAKYVAPHLRSNSERDSEEHAQLRKRVRGLLNKLSETNVESIASEISASLHSVSRSIFSLLLSEEVVASCSRGPRGNEQYAAVFAAFATGMACLVGIDFGALLLSRLAQCFEKEYLKEDNLSLRNMTLLFSYLYVFGVFSSELVYDFLTILSKRLTEVDVSTVLTVLQCCGMQLRGDNPSEMKNFILSVQSRVRELKASSEEGQSNKSSKRMEFMLETICDIKNNKKRLKEDSPQHTQMKKWLQKLKVDDILIRGLKWCTLLDPDKKGQWWLSGDTASITNKIEEVAGTIDMEIPETKKMLQLAAAQRMNTDARRAIFCVIMSGEDYIDAFEKLLRLDLPGKQDREIMRVLVECCLQEKVFNKYYCLLASKLCSFDKNHKFTLQYSLWDHFKELDSMTLIRSMHLSKFVAEMIGSFSLSLAVLKAVELNDLTQLTPKRIMHFRVLFEAIFEFPDKLVWNIFTRVAITPEYEPLRNGIEFFVRNYVVSSHKSFPKKFKIAKKALNNVEGTVM